MKSGILRRPFSLKQKVRIGFGLALVFFGGVGALSYKNSIQNFELTTKISQSHQILDGLQDVFQDILDIETGSRGYTITGNQNFLRPYEEGLGRLPKDLEVLRGLTRETLSLQKEFSQFEPILLEKIKHTQESVSIRKTKGFEAAQEKVLSGKGLMTMEQLRDTIGKMKESERVALERRVSQFKRGYRQNALFMSLGSLFSFVLIFLVFKLLGREITHREETEATLRENEERLNLALKSSGVGTWVWDIQKNKILWDDYMSPLFGLKPGDYPKTYEGFIEMVWPEDREKVQRDVTAAVEKNIEYDTSFRVTWKDGSEHVLGALGKAYRNPQGLPIRMTGVCWDVTEHKKMEDALRKSHEELESRVEERTLELSRTNEELRNEIVGHQRAEAELKKSEARFQTMVAASPVGIFLTDVKGECIYANRVYEQIAGRDFKEVQGRGWEKAIHPEDRERVSQRWYEAAKKRIPFESVHRFIHPDGSVVWANVRASEILENKTLLGYVGIVEDVTERLLAEEKTRLSREQLRWLAARLDSVREEERTRMAREIHDELGQELTGIKMDLSWLEKKLASIADSPELPLFVKKLRETSDLVDSTIQTVRKISTELRPGVLDDLGLAAAIEWQAQEIGNRTGIQFKINCHSPHFNLSTQRATNIFRIYQEILTNVVRHAKATEVEIHLRKNKDRLLLEVKDNGKGITEKEIGERKSLGILGMRERALLLDGEINIVGFENKGTWVQLEVPLEKGVSGTSSEHSIS